MGCFLACFGSSKEGRRRNQRKYRYQRHGSQRSPQLIAASDQDTSAEPLNLKSELLDKLEEALSLTTGKKFTSDTNTHGSQRSPQPIASSEQGNSAEPRNLKSEVLDKVEVQLSSSPRKKVTFNTNVKTYEPVSVHESTELLPEIIDKENEKNQKDYSLEKASSLSHSLSDDDSIISSVGSYPPNHRYQNYRDSDEEIEEFEYEDNDLDYEDEELEEYSDSDEGEKEILDEKVWSESIPTASIESRTEISSALAVTEEVNSPLICSRDDKKILGLNRNGRDRSLYVHPVLNPVENITQWKAVKSKGALAINPRKENIAANQEEPRLSFSFMSKSDQPTQEKQEIAVDASLSNWLVSSKSTSIKKTSTVACGSERSMSQGSNSVMSIEDRPILGALTMDEIKQFSASNSPRKSPSRSPDEMPIIGTVGTYWSDTGFAKDSGSASSYKGIPNTTSKYREDKRVNWHSTPFETRLERALTRHANEA